ncbi:MAG TPA: hypothetical protein VJY42_02555 [Candidatus Methanomethylophilaceae archaeon]|nr:hypothetical protein [Candidatus Methanomethylophilaceae archaeon]
MARKTSTVLLMMTGTLVLLVLVGGLGLMLITDYDAIEYEYEVTGTHDVFYESLQITQPRDLSGTVSTTHMDIFGVTRVTTISDITYFNTIDEPEKKYDLAGKWRFFSDPDLGTMIGFAETYDSEIYGILSVDKYEAVKDNEVILRWVGHDDGIVYRVERTITNGEFTTNIIQNLVNYEETKMPFKL